MEARTFFDALNEIILLQIKGTNTTLEHNWKIIREIGEEILKGQD